MLLVLANMLTISDLYGTFSCCAEGIKKSICRFNVKAKGHTTIVIATISTTILLIAQLVAYFYQYTADGQSHEYKTKVIINQSFPLVR